MDKKLKSEVTFFGGVMMLNGLLEERKIKAIEVEEPLGNSLLGILQDQKYITLNCDDDALVAAVNEAVNIMKEDPGVESIQRLRSETCAITESIHNASLSNKVKEYMGTKVWKDPDFADAYGLTIVEGENKAHFDSIHGDYIALDGTWGGLAFSVAVKESKIVSAVFNSPESMDTVAYLKKGQLTVLDEALELQTILSLVDSIGKTSLVKSTVTDLEENVKKFALNFEEDGVEVVEVEEKSYKPLKKKYRKPLSPGAKRKNRDSYRKNKASIKKANARYRKSANGKKALAMAAKRRKLNASFDREAAFENVKFISSTLTRSLIECEHNVEVADFLNTASGPLVEYINLATDALLKEDGEMLELIMASFEKEILLVGTTEEEIATMLEADCDDSDGDDLDWESMDEEDLRHYLGDEFYEKEVAEGNAEGDADGSGDAEAVKEAKKEEEGCADTDESNAEGNADGSGEDSEKGKVEEAKGPKLTPPGEGSLDYVNKLLDLM